MKAILANGTEIPLGTTEAEPVISLRDYSRRVTDDFGATTVVRRGFSRRLSVRVAIPFDQVDAVRRRLDDLRATVATWQASGRLAWLAVSGLYKELSIDLATPPLSRGSLTIEGIAETETVADAGEDPATAGKVSTCQVLDPTEVTDVALAASNVPENDAPGWSAVATYAKDAEVIRAHRVYRSLIGGNVGQEPAATPAAWLDIGPTNRWAMFDQALGTSTEAAGELSIRLSIGRPTAVALLDVVGASVRVQAPGYNRTIAVGEGPVTFLDLPGNAGDVTIRVTGSGTVKVGTLLIGRLLGLGTTEASPSAGITDYSRIETDDFGEVTIVRRGSSKKMQMATLIRSDAVDVVANRLAALRSVPALWIGREGMDTLTIYGFWKDASIPVGHSTSKLSIEIEGMAEAAKVVPFTTGVDWPDVGDPDGTKPQDNADVTSENTAKDTAAVGGRPAEAIKEAIDQALADAAAVTATVQVQDGRITEARQIVDQATNDLLTLTGRVDAITAGGDVGDLTARVETIEGAQADQDSAIAAVRQTVESGSNSNAALRASITEQSTALTTLDQSVADRFTSLRAGYTGSLAQFDQRITTVANATGSVAERTTTLEARVDNLSAGGGEDGRVPAIIARLDGNEFARTTALTAEAGRIDNVLARVGSAESRLNSTEFARSTDLDTQTGRITSALSRIGTAEGRLDSNEFTRATETTALATRTTNVEARAGNLESTVSIQGVTIADSRDKLAAARLTLKTAAGPGTEAEIELASDQAGGGRIRFGGNSLFVGEVEVQSADTRGTTKFTGAAYEVRDANGQLRVRLGLY